MKEKRKRKKQAGLMNKKKTSPCRIKNRVRVQRKEKKGRKGKERKKTPYDYACFSAMSVSHYDSCTGFSPDLN
jgi:hypothetical protein